MILTTNEFLGVEKEINKKNADKRVAYFLSCLTTRFFLLNFWCFNLVFSVV